MSGVIGSVGSKSGIVGKMNSLTLHPSDDSHAQPPTEGTLYYDGEQDSLMSHDGNKYRHVHPPRPGWGTRTSMGSRVNKFDSASMSNDLGYPSGNYYIDISGTSVTNDYVYVNNDLFDGGWILVCVARDNSTGHHTTGTAGVADGVPLDPASTSVQKYSDAYINAIMADRQYTGHQSVITWFAWADVRGYMFGYNSGGFAAGTAANGTGWDKVSRYYNDATYQYDLGGNDGSRGFGDHHALASNWEYAFNRHSASNGFNGDAMGPSNGLFYVRH